MHFDLRKPGGGVRRHILATMLPAAVAAIISCAGPRAPGPPQPPEPPVEPAPRPALERPPVVRVLILDPGKSVRIRTGGAVFLSEHPDADPLRRFDRGGNFTVRLSRDQVEITLDGKEIRTAPSISLTPDDRNNIYINGKPYRGAFMFQQAHGALLTVNYVEIDDYLNGVLPVEIGYLTMAQSEAYRVQAIASRSYALSKLDEKRGEMFDLKATIMDQVYKGVQGEHPEATAAVEETRGLVGMWGGRPIRAYYSACCGGHTADIRVGWHWKDPFPYLYGTRDAVSESGSVSACRSSRHFRWQVRWNGRQLEKILRKTLPEELKIPESSVGKLLDIEVLGYSDDGRVKGLVFVTDRGSHRVMGDRVRWVMRPPNTSNAILKSSLIKLDVKMARGAVSTVQVRGAGNGHGIGMCQAGAIKLAEMGWRTEEILLHYYPGITIHRHYR